MYSSTAPTSSSSRPNRNTSRVKATKDTQDEPTPTEDEATTQRPSPSPYRDMQFAVQRALDSQTSLSSSAKVALALEILRARQLELDLSQARKNIDSLLSKKGSVPRTLRSVIPSSAVKGLPVGSCIDIAKARFMLSPTANDPSALFLTLDIQEFGLPENDSDNEHNRNPEN